MLLWGAQRAIKTASVGIKTMTFGFCSQGCHLTLTISTQADTDCIASTAVVNATGRYNRFAGRNGRTVIGAKPLRLAQKLRVRSQEPLVNGRLQLQAEVGLAGYRLRQNLREGFAASSAGMPGFLERSPGVDDGVNKSFRRICIPGSLGRTPCYNERLLVSYAVRGSSRERARLHAREVQHWPSVGRTTDMLSEGEKHQYLSRGRPLSATQATSRRLENET